MNIELLLVLIVLTNLRLLASGRLGAAIRTVALQGVLLAALPLMAHEPGHFWRAGALALGTMALKGIVFPWLLFRALREADVEREVNPYVGYFTSLLAGVLGLAVALRLSARLPGLPTTASPLLVPVAVFSILAGLLLIVGRRRAVSQVLGFLVLENGVYTFGVGVMREVSLLVEVAVLLDVLVAVFVMGIALFHINREFDHIDADRLSSLKD
ncbi:MAG TPA: hydrogenase [Candidatus Paceibacterota bacterium]|nr:hydrogenase [Verrucomicrobiota bacterium]HRY49892.1 hydrogenase [Candidatus Paceibacterota bacterium]